MSFGQIIKGTLLPKVPLVELYDVDTAYEANGPYLNEKSSPDSAQRIGALEPFVKIGDQIVKNIQTLTIDETGFLPRVSMTFIDTVGEFKGDRFPKTNLIMNLYIKAPSSKFKPIRCDFLITSVTSSVDSTGKAKIGKARYTVYGELHVPRIYDNVSKSYRGMTSKDALKAVCSDLGLGFAENDSSPSDKMTWINTNDNYIQFIQDVVSHAYQDDDSFFSAFIDKYYYLNYIEVNKQLAIGGPQKTFMSIADPMLGSINQLIKDDPEMAALEETTGINYLTTETFFKGAVNYIESIAITSEQGEIIKKRGYKKHIYYYDHLRPGGDPMKKTIDFSVTPLHSVDRNQKTYLIPEDESLAKTEITKWMNIDYGNAHPEWNAARLINSHNNRELDKVKMTVRLNHIHFQNARGFAVPVYVSIRQAESMIKTGESSEPVEPGTLDKERPDTQLSGHYYVSGAKYVFDRLSTVPFSTELTLARREWKPSKKTD